MMINKIYNSFKKLDKVNKFEVICIIIILILMTINIFMNIIHLNNYIARTNQGNNRWFQVEERILDYEGKVDEFIQKVNDLELLTK